MTFVNITDHLIISAWQSQQELYRNYFQRLFNYYDVEQTSPFPFVLHYAQKNTKVCHE